MIRHSVNHNTPYGEARILYYCQFTECRKRYGSSSPSSGIKWRFVESQRDGKVCSMGVLDRGNKDGHYRPISAAAKEFAHATK